MGIVHTSQDSQFINYSKNKRPMKKLLIFILALLSVPAFSKNEYTIFILRGNVEVVENGVTKQLTKQMLVDENTQIIVHPNAYLSLKSSEKKRHTITIDKAFKGRIKNLGKKCKKKHTKEFMLLTKNKIDSDFCKNGHFIMSTGGYNTRDIFSTEEEEEAIKELIEMLKSARIITNDE